MLTLWWMPQLQDDIHVFILRLAGAPPLWSAYMRDYLDEHLSQWAPKSPDFISCDFFLWGYIRDKKTPERRKIVVDYRNEKNVYFLKIAEMIVERTVTVTKRQTNAKIRSTAMEKTKPSCMQATRSFDENKSKEQAFDCEN
ncbi:hypothetical protein TNCV_751311 [Trichonephila clavipes]|nr:hypothetical protein TNCV_751311 [Trichonephila clavipes]